MRFILGVEKILLAEDDGCERIAMAAAYGDCCIQGEKIPNSGGV